MKGQDCGPNIFGCKYLEKPSELALEKFRVFFEHYIVLTYFLGQSGYLL